MTSQEIKILKKECKNVKNSNFDEKYYVKMFEFFKDNDLNDLQILLLTKLRDVKVENNCLELKDRSHIVLSIDLKTYQAYVKTSITDKPCEIEAYLKYITDQLEKYKNTSSSQLFKELLVGIMTMGGIAYTMIKKAEGQVSQDFLGFLEAGAINEEPENGLWC